MRKFLFASHAYLAEGVKSALELIMGEQESVVMNLICRKDEECPTEKMIQECIEEAKESICFCNARMCEETEDEDF